MHSPFILRPLLLPLPLLLLVLLLLLLLPSFRRIIGTTPRHLCASENPRREYLIEMRSRRCDKVRSLRRRSQRQRESRRREENIQLKQHRDSSMRRRFRNPSAGKENELKSNPGAGTKYNLSGTDLSVRENPAPGHPAVCFDMAYGALHRNYHKLNVATFFHRRESFNFFAMLCPREFNVALT